MSVDLVRSAEFFYDPFHIYEFNNRPRTIEELKAHSVLLGGNLEGYLKVATLIDGSTIDFLFGVKSSTTNSFSRARANEVKRLIRCMGSRQQEEVARFYLSVYCALITYYTNRDNYCGWLWTQQLKQAAHNDLQRAFNALAVSLEKSKREEDY